MLVTPEVKAFMSPNTLLEKPCTPLTIEAAMAAPGREAAEVDRPPGVDSDGTEAVEAVGRKVGS